MIGAASRTVLPILVLALLLGCSGDSDPATRSTASAPPTPPTATDAGASGTPSPTITATPSPTAAASSTAKPSPTAPPTPTRSLTPDPRNRYYTDDRTRYASPWYRGRHRIMIEYGCTPAPYYSPDPRCDDGRGFHHGIDIALPCGAEIRAGRAGRVVGPSRPGTPGPAYGDTAFRIRTRSGQDVLIGHARRVFVDPGDRIRRGQPIALAGARGAPDGCHLHLEVRAADGGLDTARDPAAVIDLQAR